MWIRLHHYIVRSTNTMHLTIVWHEDEYFKKEGEGAPAAQNGAEPMTE